MKVARFWEKVGDKVSCRLCPHACLLGNGEWGKCGVRRAVGGRLVAEAYGRVVALAVDPIEKKPLFHFWPGSRVFSIALPGCNLSCQFCQNWEISQMKRGVGTWDGVPQVKPEQIVNEAIKRRCQGIAYTYTEPTVNFEFFFDVARIASKKGLYNVWVSNGMMNPKPVKEISEFVNAVNIDIKSFTDEFYRKICGGVGVKPVLRAIEEFHKNGVWVEITTLVIPELNDGEPEIKKIAEWVKRIDPSIPFHLSRFHPDYHLSGWAPTPEKTLLKLSEVARVAGLNYVYVSNMTGADGGQTRCPACGTPLLERRGFLITENRLSGANKCPKCGRVLEMMGKVIKGSGGSVI